MKPPLQTFLALLVLGGFAAFVLYAAYLFIWALPLQAIGKIRRRREKAGSDRQDLELLAERMARDGPSTAWDARSSLPSWLANVAFGRHLIDLERFSNARDFFPPERCYVQTFPPTGSGEPGFSFLDVTLAIRQRQGKADCDYRNFVTETDEAPLQGFNGARALLDLAQERAERERAKEGGIRQAWALVVGKNGSVTLYSACGEDLPRLELKNFLYCHLKCNVRMDNVAGVAFCMPTPEGDFPFQVGTQPNEGRMISFLWAEWVREPALVAHGYLIEQAGGKIKMEANVRETDRVFLPERKRDKSGDSILNYGY